jgi:hypothetical protein
MKVIVLEVYKKYCILMTEDGQFLTKNIPAGLHEIGDEIIVDRFKEIDTLESRKLFKIISRIAVGFAAVAVIITGSYFGVKFLRTQITPEGAAMIAQSQEREQFLESPEATFELKSEQALQKDIPEEAMAAEAAPEILEESKDSSIEAFPAGNKLFEGGYSLKNAGIDIPITFSNINITYRIDEGEQSLFDFLDKERKLTFNFESINQNSSFNGNADISLLNKDLTVTKSHIVIFDDFSFGQKKTEIIPLLDELSFKFIMYGFFE